ncbi:MULTISPECIES: E22 family MetX-like putative esterase [Idiomarina]|uniref:E22 family MetX-like putative esterase n=1 Tax=Idiomarina TaxID=135575 RepID=UPI000C600795|nr:MULTISPECIES: homoserine O-acetyltransferase [Idiomarina]MBP58121.1 homoserine acetyltransferase [Idiomarina sp.]|tara:strand:- start:6528 stop:7706 length:1179 start_codon:yes stop_codon:yes gene_type:complete
MTRLWTTVISIAVLLISLPLAAEQWVEKKTFSMDSYTTHGGETIKDVKVGWESYGTLNEAKDNVVLITHFFSGNSHAAGKYSEDDQQAGYWDSIIGPGKAIDTDKYYVISVDSLVNAYPNLPTVITTGPASINPDTGKPYGLDFPVVTIRDFVNVQKALLEELGVKKLHAVVGASMGSLQAIEWAAAYPDWVERMVSVIGAGSLDAWTIMGLEQWAQAIKLDPNWNGGDYYDGDAPLDGVTMAQAMITHGAMHPEYINQAVPKQETLPEKGLESVTNELPAVEWLYGASRARAPLADANHILYLVRANQLFVAGHQDTLKDGLKNISAKTLFLPSSNDLLLMPYMAENTADQLRDMGKKVQYEEINGPWGHLNGLFSIQQKAELLSEFLTTE